MVEVGTFIRNTLFTKMFSWYAVTPTTLKKLTTGKGNADKARMAAAVKERWSFESKSDDVIDAYAIAQIGRELYLHNTDIQGVTREN